MHRRDLILFLSLSTCLGACGKQRKLPAIAAGQTALAFGDSVTFGTGAANEQAWPTRLAQQTGWRIINAGVPGDTAEAGKTRIQALIDEHTPALVIIEIGGNDFLRRRDPKAIKEDLRRIIRSAKRSGAAVVLIAVPELSLLGIVARKPSDSPIYQALANEEGVTLVSNVFAEILGRPELCADQIHPNAAGYQKLAEGIYAVLRHSGLIASGT